MQSELLPRKCWKLVFLASECLGSFLPRSIQSCFQLLQGSGCRKSLSALCRSNWVKISDRIEKNIFFDPIGDCNRI